VRDVGATSFSWSKSIWSRLMNVRQQLLKDTWAQR
jgi:hypothetical protein